MPRTIAFKKLDLYGIVDTGANDPASGDTGELFYNTTSSELKIYINNAWLSIGSSTPAGGTFDFVDNTEFQFIDSTYFDFIG